MNDQQLTTMATCPNHKSLDQKVLLLNAVAVVDVVVPQIKLIVQISMLTS